MNIVGDYIYVESIDELKNRSAFDNEKDIFVNYLGIFHDANAITYPHIFECHKNCDRGCVDEYFPVSNDEMVFAIKKKIERWMSDIAASETLLKKLENIE